MFLAAYTHLLKYSWNSMSSSKQTTAVSRISDNSSFHIQSFLYF